MSVSRVVNTPPLDVYKMRHQIPVLESILVSKIPVLETDTKIQRVDIYMNINQTRSRIFSISQVCVRMLF